MASLAADLRHSLPLDGEANDQWYFPALQPAILTGSASASPRTISPGGFIVLRSALDTAR